jgi:hypothetical protein
MPDLTPEQIEALIAERDTLAAGLQAERSRADELDGRVRRTDTQMADAAIRACDAEITALEEKAANLNAEGNFAEAAKINTMVGDATARRNAARQSKAYFEQQHGQLKAQPTDPVERFLAANPDFSEAEQKWIRENPRYATDRGFRDRVNAAHGSAQEKGFPRGSEDYFKHLADAGYMRPVAIVPKPGEGEVEETPFSSAATEGEEMNNQPPPRPRATAAPPSRRSPTSGGERIERGRLNADQMEMAMRMAELTAPTEVLDGGPAAVAKWWQDIDTSPAAARKREEWAQL